MFLQNSVLTEFLSEANLVLAQENFGNQLEDLLVPIKNFLQKEKHLLSFSLARYCGGNSQLAFFCEWLYQQHRLTRNNYPLFLENKEYLKHKLTLQIAALPNLESLLDQQVTNWYLPYQLVLMHNISKEQMLDLVTKYGYLNRYLNNKFLSKIISSDLQSQQAIISGQATVSQFLEWQGYSLSSLLLSLPCLVGFVYNFHQSDSPINPAGVKWFLVEEILTRIASLHQIATTKNLVMFLYRQTLSNSDSNRWLQLPKTEQITAAELDESTTKQKQSIVQKLSEEVRDRIEKLIFPEKYKTMFQDLLDWVLDLGFGQLD